MAGSFVHDMKETSGWVLCAECGEYFPLSEFSSEMKNGIRVRNAVCRRCKTVIERKPLLEKTRILDNRIERIDAERIMYKARLRASRETAEKICGE